MEALVRRETARAYPIAALEAEGDGGVREGLASARTALGPA